MNMYEMFKTNESGNSQSEQQYLKWRRRVESMMNASSGSLDDDLLSALYDDGCTPEDAVLELNYLDGDE